MAIYLNYAYKLFSLKGNLMLAMNSTNNGLLCYVIYFLWAGLFESQLKLTQG